MINANEARLKLQLNADREKAITTCKKWTEYSIQEAIKNGRNRTCLANTSSKVNGKYYNVEKEIKEWLRSLGYEFAPTGYIGGVWQLTEDIVW